jgi:hypothetical protein
MKKGKKQRVINELETQGVEKIDADGDSNLLTANESCAYVDKYRSHERLGEGGTVEI